MSREYTVVGIHPGGSGEGRDGTFVESFTAVSPVHAALKARRAFAREPDETGCVEILAVFEGRHADLMSACWPITEKDEAKLEAMDAELEEENEA